MIVRRGLPLLAALLACSSPAPAPSTGGVTAGAVAICAGKPISSAEIASVATAQRLSARQATEALAHDARFATEAEQLGVLASPVVESERKALLVRLLLEQLKQANHAPPSADELAALRKDRWRDFDRPEGARVVHAIALGENNPRARKIAEAFAAATNGAKDAADFEARAQAVGHDGVEVRIEKLPMLARDGRSLEDEGNFVRPFAEAALALKTPGAISPVVGTEFGYHVIFLIERSEAYRPSDEELARIARDELLSRRWFEDKKRLLARLHEQDEISIARNAGELTKTVRVRSAAP